MIHNDFGKAVNLNIEPEGANFRLEQGHDVSVTDAYADVPVTITLARQDSGDPVLSIWPGDGQVKVESDGHNVLDLM